MRRRSCASTKNTYRIWNRIVGTVKKSTETMVFTWLSRKVFQVWDGGLRRHTRYLLTLVSPMSIPSLKQFAMNARSAPEWILAAHGANQRAHLLRYGRPVRLTATDLPGPEQTKAFPVPADDGRGFDDKDAGLPIVPYDAQPGPQQPIRLCQFGSLDRALQNAELMAEGQDLQLERRAAPEGSENRG